MREHIKAIYAPRRCASAKIASRKCSLFFVRDSWASRENVMAMGDRAIPLVYSCSGCSSAAQMANYIAICLDRSRHAEMSCIAGVGGDVPSLVRLAKSGRPVIAIDGCPLHCARHCLARHAVQPAMHLTLTKVGVKKRYHAKFSEDEAVAVYRSIVSSLQNGPPIQNQSEGVRAET